MLKKAYAKVNLMIRVLDKRNDGYHNLQMLNARVNLYDIIVINDYKKDEVVFTNVNGINKEYIYKVLKTFKDAFHINKKYSIKITKFIPVGAGLGGGSMDCATILDMLIEKENINCSIEEKIELFKSLGADVPYGFYMQPAIVTGIGEKIEIFDLPEYDLVLVNPLINVKTETIFNIVNTNNSILPIEKLTDAIKNNQTTYFTNDLEEATFSLYPEIKTLKEELQAFGYVVMSGSGSSLLVFTNHSDEIRKQYPNYFVSKLKIK